MRLVSPHIHGTNAPSASGASHPTTAHSRRFSVRRLRTTDIHVESKRRATVTAWVPNNLRSRITRTFDPIRAVTRSGHAEVGTDLPGPLFPCSGSYAATKTQRKLGQLPSNRGLREQSKAHPQCHESATCHVAKWHGSCSWKNVAFAITEADMDVNIFMGVLLLSFGLLVPILVLQPGRRRTFSAPRSDSDHHHS
jgi:hypothetical protein